ncbi:MAG TPA: hypothetical protein VH917_01365 [Ignavibacteriaceae bacterium]
MKKYLSILLASAFFLILHCSEEDPVNPGKVQKYPDSLGTEWEYHTTYVLVFYDSSGIIYGEDTLDFGNTIAKVIKVNDSLENYKDLSLLISYDISSPQYVGNYWYKNSNNDFSLVAYSSAGSSQPILPKGNSLSYIELYFKHLKNALTPILSGFHVSSIDDTIYFNDPPRKVLQYPLIVGNTWVEMSSPFFRRRFISKKTDIDTPAGRFTCFVIETEMPEFPNIIFEDYLNLEQGLVLRKVRVDSMTHIVGSDTVGFFNSASESKLIRKD